MGKKVRTTSAGEIPIFFWSYYNDEGKPGNLPLPVNLRMWESVCINFTHGKFNENTAIPNFMYNQLVENNWMREHGLIVRSSSGRTIPPRIKSDFCLCPLRE